MEKAGCAAPFSTNVERVALALAHEGLAVESVVIDYSDRSEVERVSGQGPVPVIDDDGTVVVDSMEIVRYLEERYPDAPLYPADEARRAEMLIFIDWFNRVWKGPPNAQEVILLFRADGIDLPHQWIEAKEERSWAIRASSSRGRSPCWPGLRRVTSRAAEGRTERACHRRTGKNGPVR